jgi:integrase
MATIQERKSEKGTTYRVMVRLKGYPVQTASFNRKTDAKTWATQTEAAIREGRHFKTSEAKRHTLKELIARYIRDILPTKPKSEAKQKNQLEWWSDKLGIYALADVTPAKIAEVRDELANGDTYRGTKRSPSTVNRYLAALSHAFTIAVKEWGWIESNPLSKIRKLKEPRGRVRFLSEEERKALLEACKQSKSPYLYLVVVLLLSTGARRSEIINLRWSDVDLSRRIILLEETKNGERRVLPLGQHVYDLLYEYAKEKHTPQDLLFPDSRDKNKPVEVRAAWDKAVLEAKLADFRLHDLRHSAASYLAMNGASLTEIAEILGHKTLQMVKRYSHFSEAHTAKVVSDMNERIFG